VSTAEALDTIFGRIVTGADVEDWVFACLQTWSCTYLAEVERQHGITPGTLPDVRAWVPTHTFDKWPEDQVPAVFVINTGLAERPVKGGDGAFYVRWQMQIGVLTSARTEAQAHKLAQLYLAAHRVLLLQRPSLDGMADGTEWIGEGDMPLNFDDTRTLAARVGTFVVTVDRVCFANQGPVTPAEPLVPCTDPWPQWSTAQLVEIEVDNIGITDPMPSPTERSE
jgi:hypothetical protein